MVEMKGKKRSIASLAREERLTRRVKKRIQEDILDGMREGGVKRRQAVLSTIDEMGMKNQKTANILKCCQVLDHLVHVGLAETEQEFTCNATRLVDERLSAKLIDVMLQHQTHWELMLTACSILGNMMFRNPTNVRSISEQNGVEAIFPLLQGKTADPRLISLACFAFGNMAVGNPGDILKITELGAIELVIDAMKQHGTHARLMSNACMLLGNIVVEKPDSIEKIVKLDGVNLILSAMHQHPTNVDLLRISCCALANLMGQNGVNVGKEGMTVILTTMKQHTVVAGLMEDACCALANLLFCHVENVVQFVRLSGPTILLAAMKRHSARANLVARACLAVANMIPHVIDNVALILNQEMTPILDAISANMDHDQVSLNGCRALGNIVQYHGDSVFAYGTAIAKVLLAILTLHAVNPVVCEAVCVAIKKVAQHSSQYQVKLVQQKADTIITSTMQAQMASGNNWLRYGRRALISLSRKKVND
jgi:hypothetical protein